jgi:CubicO group peptidase (beta-lactamase class C family)
MSQAASVLVDRPFPHDEVVDAPLVGVDADALQRALRIFRRQHRKGLFPGGQLVVRRHGRIVLDAAIGKARGLRADEDELAVTPFTRFPCFSAGKAVVATMLALLEHDGLLDVHAPIAELWPAFGSNGKGAITTLDVLTHRGGVLMPELCVPGPRWNDWEGIVAAIEQAPPSHRRGAIRYHPLEYGWILGEIVQRASGQSFRDFLRQRIAAPAGLPDLRFGARPDEIDGCANTYYLGRRPVRVAGFEVNADLEHVASSPATAAALLPGAGLVTDAGTLAAFYEVLVRGGVTASGQRLLSRATLDAWIAPVVTGWCRTNQAPITLGRGFFVGSRLPSLYGVTPSFGVFGHAGLFCTLGFADANTGLAAAIVTNGNRSKTDLVQRMMPLVGALRSACR